MIRPLEQVIAELDRVRDDLRGYATTTPMDPISRERTAKAQDYLRMARVSLRLLTRDFSAVITDSDSPAFDAAVQRTLAGYEG